MTITVIVSHDIKDWDIFKNGFEAYEVTRAESETLDRSTLVVSRGCHRDQFLAWTTAQSARFSGLGRWIAHLKKL